MTAEHEHGNVNPIGQLVSAALALVCTPNGPASGGHAIGAITTEKTLCQTLAAGRFLRFRRATETPFNLVFEARP